MKELPLLIIVFLTIFQFASSRQVDSINYSESDESLDPIKTSSQQSKTLPIVDDEMKSVIADLSDETKREAKIQDLTTIETITAANESNETSTEKSFRLSEIINRIEEAFLKSADNIINAFKKLNSNSTAATTSEDSSKNEENSIENITSTPTKISNFRINRKAVSSEENSQESKFKLKIDVKTKDDKDKNNAERIGMSDRTKLGHRISKRSGNDALSTTTTMSSTIKETPNNQSEITSSKFSTDSTVSESEKISNDEMIKMTTLTSEIPTISTPSTSSSTTISSSTGTFSTTKDPNKELKDDEEEIKEKIAEIEAEPIILTSRV